MCGIFAYTGNKQSLPILLEGLQSLEYRGYDSVGIYIPNAGIVKSVGAVQELKKKLTNRMVGTSGIAHLRWATHGEPTEVNAHPHVDCSNTIHVVHNGIIENYKELKEKLISLGHTFLSETDTEVLAHLIEHQLKETENFELAVVASLQKVKGTYGIAVSYDGEPEKIIAARLGAPVVLGIGINRHFVASDASPLLRHTKDVVYLHDGDIAVLTPQNYRIRTYADVEVVRKKQVLDFDVEQVKKDGYEHFMLKEIMEGPQVIENTTRGRLIPEKGLVKLGGLDSVNEQLQTIERIIIVGCGTAYYAGLVGEYMLEEYAGIPVEVEIGSEFRYRNAPVDAHTALLAISQSGETADTLEAIREAKRKGALTLGIVNTVGSTIARETDAGIYNHAGPEIGVASTKAFMSQLTALALLTVHLGRQRSMSVDVGKSITRELQLLPQKIQSILDQRNMVHGLTQKYADSRDFLYMGRKYNYPIAFEGALKLKEISYIHAEGCGAGEMKHGPIAMIDTEFPTLAIALNDSVYEKMLSNIEEIRARKGRVLAIATEGDTRLVDITSDIFYIPHTLEMLTPILSAAPMQLFAYYIGVAKGFNVDRPRNLAKSVTVE
ncbi:MAG: Isomerizing Glutamine-fructose-6-phosphate aminotransferase [Parcubacteria group bacterium GW2011_GWC2_42_11]|nr:MAG: Isomerizing Glutamine-fructose-6-phosphate aminotransferase [Parcubacteria group bacterium GW2011_GWC2_42_11]